MNIALIGYRTWALEIYKNIIKSYDCNYYLVESKDDFSELKLRDFKPDFVLFYGWSWIIPSSLINDFNCVMLHPSPLPKYRGGSPIQNQIINGETEGAVTLFLMDEGVDTGPIINQKKISLEGSLQNIFERIIDVGVELTLNFLKDGYSLKAQDHSKASSFKRRLPKESEISDYVNFLKPYEKKITSIHLYSVARPTEQKTLYNLGRLNDKEMIRIAEKMNELSIPIFTFS